VNLSEAANRVIDLARKVREYYDAELPRHHPNYPLVGPGEQDPPPPPEEEELRAFLAVLSDEMIYQLILIMYLGREDFGTDDLASSYEGLKKMFGDREDAVSQMLDKAPLADYLLDGLEELRKHNINADRMPLKKSKVRKK
jgi:hypothetical protein